MTEPRVYLPALLAEIAEAAGLPAALKIADARGGTRVHFPARAPDGHWLPELVGREAADKICRLYHTTGHGGVEQLVPLGPKGFYARARRMAEQLTRDGVSREEVARRLGVHIRSVQRYRGRLRDIEKRDPVQGRLF